MRRVLAAALVLGITAGLLVGASSCGSGGAAPGRSDPVALAEHQAVFPADLGPSAIDVASYPAVQQDNYRLFAEKCTNCHSLARPINSSIVDASTWGRYVRRMHEKNQGRFGGPLLSGDEAKRVISFLAFDSRERKIKRAEEFQSLQADLRARFDLVVRQRSKRKSDEGRASALESAPYVGDR